LERERKATLHRYNKNQHLIFKYRNKASAKRERLYQKQRELAEQIKDAAVKLKQHQSPKEHEQLEWNEWFYSVKWADGKQADPNQDPEAHVLPKPPSSASLFQCFMEEKYNNFFFDLIHGIHPYETEDPFADDEVTKVTVIPEDLFATRTDYNQSFDQRVYRCNKFGLPDLCFKNGDSAPTCPVQLQSRYMSITQDRFTGHHINGADHRDHPRHNVDGDFLSSNQFQVCFDTGCSQSITNSLDDFQESPTKGKFGIVKTMNSTTKIKAFGIVRWVVYDVDRTTRLLPVPASTKLWPISWLELSC
jgi:hypothetical protein